MRVLISELQLDKKIKALEHNLNSFTRVEADQEEVTVVKQMPKVEAAKQPTIAIITSQYFEKMAVDAMMTNRQTFVRYATVGEWECAFQKMPKKKKKEDFLVSQALKACEGLEQWHDMSYFFTVQAKKILFPIGLMK